MRFTAIATSLAIIAAIAVADNQPQCLAQRPTRRFKQASYQKMDRFSKMAELWNSIIPDEAVVEEPQDFFWAEQPNFFTQKSQLSFCQNSDDMIHNRPKTAHTQGLVAKVEWRPVKDNGLSGLYAEGSKTAIARISEVSNLWDGSTGHAPSIAVKFLVDGVKAENVFAQTGFSATDTWNFFEPTLSSRLFRKSDFEDGKQPLSEIAMKTLVPKLIEGSESPFALAVAGPAEYTNEGKKLNRKDIQYHVPYELRFKAPEAVKSKFSSERTSTQWYDNIKNELKAGDVLYEVYNYIPAHENMYWKKNPEDRDPRPETEVKIADLVLETDLFTSLWADNNLHFQHSHVHRDRKYWSRGLKDMGEDPRFKRTDETTWGDQVPSHWDDVMAEGAKQEYIAQNEKYGCPFAWLLGNV